VHQQLPRAKRKQHVFQNAERNAQPRRDLSSAGRADLQQKLQQQRLDEYGAQARLLNRLRLGGVVGLAAENRLEQVAFAVI
jgi:hypothetical protein